MRSDLHEKSLVLEKQVKEIKEKTELLRAKDLRLLEMDRIAGIGTLAAGIAHEINNPLSFLKSAMGFLRKSMDKILAAANYWDDKPLPEELAKGYRDYLETLNFDHVSSTVDKRFDTIQRGIERIMTIIKSLKRFSRIDMESIGNLNINESIDDAVEIFSTEETEDIEFIKEPGEIPSVECSAAEINQCLLHIITNAKDAVENKGRIVLKTSLDEAGDNIVIKIIDNGKGMSPEVLRQSRSPFFTTKEVGSGTGVGLSMTETIIKNHGGTMDISSAENEGTTVTLTLPVTGKTLPQQI
jgi:signal transduction histidine kinase